jgi:starch synthase
VSSGCPPEARIAHHFWHLKRYLNDNPDCHLEIGYREDLAHLVYAGADLLVVPSLFEPCGLAPLIAMRYGTVPVMRATGGMADTVFDYDQSGRPLAERNGYVFHHADNQAIESALDRAPRLRSARPARVRPARRHLHARRLLIDPARPGVPGHLPAHPPQMKMSGQLTK